MTIEDEHAIAKVVLRYCRGIDRRDFAMVRACYHPDATDDHGPYAGDLDGFLAYTAGELSKFTMTTHFIGNVLVDIADDDADVAHSESYALAIHRLAARGEKPERDYTVGLRYVDRFERRDGTWRIAARRCALDWARMDPVGDVPAFPAGSLLGVAGPGDVVFQPL